MKYADYLAKKEASQKIKLDEGLKETIKAGIAKLKAYVAFAKCTGKIDAYATICIQADSNYVKALNMSEKDKIEKAIDNLQETGKDDDATANKIAQLNVQKEKITNRLDLDLQTARDKKTLALDDLTEAMEPLKAVPELQIIISKRKKIAEMEAAQKGLEELMQVKNAQADSEGAKAIQSEMMEKKEKITQIQGELQQAEEDGEEAQEESKQMMKDLKALKSFAQLEKAEDELNKECITIIQKYSQVIKGLTKGEEGGGEEGGGGGVEIAASDNSGKGKKSKAPISMAVETILSAVSAAKSYKPEETQETAEGISYHHYSYLLEGEEEVKKVVSSGLADLEKLKSLHENVVKAKLDMQNEAESSEDISNTVKSMAGASYEKKDGTKVEAREIESEPPSSLIDAIEKLKGMSGEESDKEGEEGEEGEEELSDMQKEKIAKAESGLKKAEESGDEEKIKRYKELIDKIKSGKKLGEGEESETFWASIDEEINNLNNTINKTVMKFADFMTNKK